MIEYQLVKAYRSKDLSKHVSKYLNQGYVLYGSPMVVQQIIPHSEDILVYTQAIIKYKDQK